MSEININGASFVMLVRDLEQSVNYYFRLGFTYEVIGSDPKHHHVSRDYRPQ